MIRTKGEPGTGNIVEAVRHMRMVLGEIRTIQGLDEEDQDDIHKASLSSCVIASILVIIKSEIMLIEFVNTIKVSDKDKRAGVKVSG